MNPADDTQSVTQNERDEQAKEYTDRGKELLLREVKPIEAAAEFSRALQIAPNIIDAHMGMAQANFALGMFQVTSTAADYVLRLAPNTLNADIAQALLFCIAKQYPDALKVADAAVDKEPGYVYAHALRGYIFRCMRQDYDAVLAESRAARQSGGLDLRPLFPKIIYAEPAPSLFPSVAPSEAGNRFRPASPTGISRTFRRPKTRISFAFRGMPAGTITIIGLLVFLFLIQAAQSGSITNPTSGSLVMSGVLDSGDVMQGQIWRLVTSLFLSTDPISLLFASLSIYFIGSSVERIYGTVRFVAAFLIAGIVGNLVFLFLPGSAGFGYLGAVAALAGIFGVLGGFLLFFRTHIGPALNGMLMQWFFWLILNAFFLISNPVTGMMALAGLAVGILLGIVLSPI